MCLSQRSLYGLKQAPRAWFQRFAAYAARVGFHHSRCDTSLFIYRQEADIAYLLLYVDDIVLTASSISFLQRIITSLHAEFSMTDLGPLNYFLGVFVTRDTSEMFLSQQKYATEVLERAGMLTCNPCRTHVDTNSKLSADGDSVSDPTLYGSLAGALQYLTFTRPDISYVVQQVCLFMHDPREPYFSALKRILRYVRGTLSYGLQLYPSTTSTLVAYSYANWAGCPTTRQSTSGYCVFLGNNLLSWSSKRQFTISRSSTEAEYRGVANAVAETCWLRNLLHELHTPLSTATLVYCDNVSAVYLSSNPIQHQRTKLIEIDIHFIRDLVSTGRIRVLHVPFHYQYADIFTKGLPTTLFDEFRSSLSRVHMADKKNEASSGSEISESVVSDFGRRRTSCRHCKSGSDTRITHALWAQSLTVNDCQALIDKGWSRWGCSLSKRVMGETCCPCFLFRLKASDFVPSKAQVQVSKRMQRFLDGTLNVRKPDEQIETSCDSSRLSNTDSVSSVKTDVIVAGRPAVSKDSSSTDFGELYVKKQNLEIHLKSPLIFVPSSGDNTVPPCGFGSFHMQYLINGKLVADLRIIILAIMFIQSQRRDIKQNIVHLNFSVLVITSGFLLILQRGYLIRNQQENEPFRDESNDIQIDPDEEMSEIAFEDSGHSSGPETTSLMPAEVREDVSNIVIGLKGMHLKDK
nr:ribonuclease H-like domain-containing protein [Tanacetum cinerariifolium]